MRKFDTIEVLYESVIFFFINLQLLVKGLLTKMMAGAVECNVK